MIAARTSQMRSSSRNPIGGQTYTDSFTAVTADGTPQTVTVTITGVNDTAQITGTTTGAVTEDAASSLTTSGTLTVTDVDTGQAVFVAQASEIKERTPKCQPLPGNSTRWR